MKPKKLRGVYIQKHGVKELYNWINARLVAKACDDFFVSRGMPIKNDAVYVMDQDVEDTLDQMDH